MTPSALTQRVQAVSSSPTLRITALAKQLKAQGKKVISLAAGEPDFDTPEAVKEAAITAIREGFTKYTPTAGMPQLRDAVTQVLAKERGLTYQREQVLITSGAKQALFALMQTLVQPGDEVLVPSPYWVSYPEMVRLAGAQPVEIRTDPVEGFRLNAWAVEQACTERTRCLILNSPSNPTGAVLDEQVLKEIAQVAQRRNLWVVSDEIYCRLSYESPAPSIARVAPQVLDRTIVVDGVSKAYSMTGWRIGYLAGPVDVVKAANRLQDHSTSNPASISQRAALEALSGDQAPVQQMREAFGKRRDLLVARLDKIPQVSFVKPEGAFYCFVDISKTGLSSDEFAERILQEALVALIPGTGFGWEYCVRLSFALGEKSLLEGLDRFEAFIKKL
jgi:aspartate aminotransferase